MRLTCPACAAAYDLPDDRLPAGGSHVQCTACHTRWFARALGAGPARPSEDQIIARLDTRAERQASAPSGFAGPRPLPIRAAAPIAFPGTPRAPQQPAADAAPEAAEAEAPRIVVDAPPAPHGPTSTSTARPAPHAPRDPAIGSTPLRQRPAADGAERPVAQPAPGASRPGSSGRAGIGALLAAAIAAAALGVYARADAIAAGAPAAAPALADYATAVDAARVWIEARLGPLRDGLTGG